MKSTLNVIGLAFVAFCFVYPNAVFAQKDQPKAVRTRIGKRQHQTVRGRVIDRYSKQPLVGVLISIENVYPYTSTFSNDNGTFVLNNVPVGRRTIAADFAGYDKLTLPNVPITSGKEVYIELEMASDAESSLNQPLNDLSLVSARSFSVEETQRFPANMTDPGRTVMNFAGTQAVQDNESDVIIRGNPSASTSWRVEGLDIPNPNHFARPNTMGGGLTSLSTSLLGNSDLITGGWNASYGNTLSGVFDMFFRKGNLHKREYGVKLGLIGVEFGTEGPIKKEQSSYLFNYRYSTLGILNNLGIYLVRENVSNSFQDLSFNLNFNSKDNKTVVNVFGLGGISDELWSIKPDTSKWETELDYVLHHTGSNLAVLGANITRALDESSYLKFVVGGSYSEMFLRKDLPRIDDPQNLSLLVNYNYVHNKASFTGTYHRKFNERLRLQAGIAAHGTMYNLLHEQRVGTGIDTFLNDKGFSLLGQAFGLVNYKITKKLTLNAGAHALFLSLNSTYNLDPRVSLRYHVSKGAHISAAWGLYSATLPIGTYLMRYADATSPTGYSRPNEQLKMPQSQQAILSYQQSLSKDLYFQVEGYYQHLRKAPISLDTASTFWFYHIRDDYGTIPMTNQGEGRNYGMNITVEKGFNKGYSVLGTASIWSAQYKTLANEWRSSRFDSRYMFTCLFVKEIMLPRASVFQMSIKGFVTDGLRYTPADTAASIATGALVLNQAAAFTAKTPIHYRTDARFSFRKNAKRVTYIVAIDIQNLTNRKNFQQQLYDRQNQTIINRYYSGLVPVLYFNLDF